MRTVNFLFDILERVALAVLTVIYPLLFVMEWLLRLVDKPKALWIEGEMPLTTDFPEKEQKETHENKYIDTLFIPRKEQPKKRLNIQ